MCVNCVNDGPHLLRCENTLKNNWLKVKAIGVNSNRSGIGARVICSTGSHRQTDEVRSGGSYLSNNDKRLHFGLGSAAGADWIEVRWPSGATERFPATVANREILLTEGQR